MKTIWKFKLGPVAVISIPAKAEVLCVQLQRDEPHMWVLLDPAEPRVDRQFFTYGTGRDLSPERAKATYVGTFQTYGGNLVFHVFESSNRKPDAP
jgi:hypothetical protein